MRRVAKAKKPSVVAVALTWDGARAPVSGLSVKARAFLKAGVVAAALTPKRMAELLAERRVKEIRVCWVPRLSGGREVLAVPFSREDGKRVGFRMVRRVELGECLGVVYRR